MLLRLSSIALVCGLCRDRRVRDALEQALAADLDRARLDTAVTAAAIEDRAAALIEAIQRAGAGELVQTSLFDRRIEQQAQLRSAAVAAWTRNLERHRDAARASRSIAAAGTCLVAAWFE